MYNANGDQFLNIKVNMNAALTRLKVLPEKNYLATVSGNYVDIFDTTQLIRLITYSGHESNVLGLEYINNATLASSDSGASIHIWNSDSGSSILIIDLPRENANCLQLLNTSILASGQDTGSIKLWNITNGTLISTISNLYSMQAVNDLELINDQVLASSNSDSYIYIWHWPTQSFISTLTGHTSAVYALKRLTSSIMASGSDDTHIIIWDLTTGTSSHTLMGHTDAIRYSLELYDDQTLVSASYDQTVKLWSIETGSLIQSFDTNQSLNALATLGICD